MFNTDYFKVVFIITSKCFNEAVFHFSQDFFKNFFLLSILIFQPLSLMPSLADPVMHFYGLFRKLPSASQPHLSSCLLGALHLRRKLFWSDSSWFLLQPESQAVRFCYFNLSVLVVATSCCHLISLRSFWNRIYKICDVTRFIDYKCWKSV